MAARITQRRKTHCPPADSPSSALIDMRSVDQNCDSAMEEYCLGLFDWMDDAIVVNSACVETMREVRGCLYKIAHIYD
jgi:hypothetical protein